MGSNPLFEASDATNGGNPTGARRRILIVEDNSDMRDFLRRVLASHGYAYLEAADGVEGIRIARQDHPDLILMDMSLPEMDGFEATRRLKADPQTKHTPIVAVTAHARPADEQRALEAGCDGYLRKPYSLREFLDIVQSFLPLPLVTA